MSVDRTPEPAKVDPNNDRGRHLRLCRGLDERAALCAAERAEQLAGLRADLAAGRQVTDHDVASARRHATESHIRAHRAHLAAAEQHRKSAEAHASAAQVHEEAAARGIGDVDAHLREAASHRIARDNCYRAASKAERLAEAEFAVMQTVSRR